MVKVKVLTVGVCVGVVAIGWQSYLSYLNQRTVEEEGAEAEAEGKAGRVPGTDGVRAPVSGRSTSGSHIQA